MKKIIILASSIAAILVVTITILVVMFVDFGKPSRNATSKYDDGLVQSVGNFTASTAGSLLKKEENTCYSPASLYVALCLSAELMNESASKEVLTSLNYEDLNDMENRYDELIDRMVSVDSVKNIVNIANSVWVQEDIMKSDTEGYINERTKRIPMEIFCKNYDVKEVNDWISDKTNGLIDNALQQAEEFLVINTTYFKGKWGEPFSLIGEEDFKLSSGDIVQAEYMKATYEDNYVSGKDYVAVEQRYLGNSKMIFVLPDKNKELKDLTNAETINEIIASFSNDNVSDMAEITLKVPKFETKSDIEDKCLKESLDKVGIKEMFNVGSWSDMVDTSNLADICINQKTRISVDEEGTEAAAVTIVSGSPWGVEEEEKVIKLDITLDKPFMYIIMYDDVPLFIGTVYNPTEG
ncbi:MAG: serpin family protein [Lachnospiraceae bacterium]|nr:serpin family protein [Lachnospiraceae bacterium]